MLIPFLIPFVIAIFLAINMGGSGTGPSFSAAYGANIIKKNVIPGFFGLMVFIGAVVAGKQTATTLSKGLLDPNYMSYVVVSIILFSVAISLLIANLFGIPQSTSQSTVLAVAAAATYFQTLNKHTLFVEIIPTWLITPVVSFIIALLVGRYIYRPLRKKGYTISAKVNNNPILKVLIVVMSMYVAFSIGANNVANAAGPLASMASKEIGISDANFVHVLILATLIVAPNFALGSSIFGNKILKNTGKEIVLFGRIEAVIIAFISASLLLAASLIKGVPTSLVQLNVGAILGIGVAKLGFKNIFRKTEVNKFFVMWIIAPAIAFGICLLLIFLSDEAGL
ncbi:MAG TPA: inorganic phosphate transporter, partial [Bacteroidetes bacterium]|nr:inorganic phosphate transporter [Bacteroidota bacterium]